MRTISVSKVIQETKPYQDKEALELWVKRVGEEKAEQIRTEAIERGKNLDANFENYTITGTCEHLPLYNYLLPLEVNYRELKVECQVAPDVTLKGRIDGIATDKNGQTKIIEFKTASKNKEEKYIQDYFLQVGAYYYLLTALDKAKTINSAQIVIFVNDDILPQIFRMNKKQLEGYAEIFIKRLAEYLDCN